MNAIFTGDLPVVQHLGWGRIGGYIADLTSPVMRRPSPSSAILMIPTTRLGYRPFMRRRWPRRHGRITIGAHPVLGQPAGNAIARYDRQATFARVTVWEDSVGVYVAGRVTLLGWIWGWLNVLIDKRDDWFPDGFSPDWRRVDGHLELVGIAAVVSKPVEL